jgi:hypothetical protein
VVVVIERVAKDVVAEAAAVTREFVVGQSLVATHA